MASIPLTCCQSWVWLSVEKLARGTQVVTVVAEVGGGVGTEEEDAISRGS